MCNYCGSAYDKNSLGKSGAVHLAVLSDANLEQGSCFIRADDGDRTGKLGDELLTH